MLDLHVFLENVRDLVHVFAHRVAFHYKLAAARISYDIAVVCRNCLESRTSREKSLGSSFIAREVVGLNVQCRNCRNYYQPLDSRHSIIYFLKHGQCEGKSLACSSMSLAHKVSALEKRRDSHGLYGEWLTEAHFSYSLEQWKFQAETFEPSSHESSTC